MSTLAFVQSKKANVSSVIGAGGTNAGPTFTNPNVAGNTILVYIEHPQSADPTGLHVVSNNGNTYVQVGTTQSGGAFTGGGYGAVFAATGINAGTERPDYIFTNGFNTGGFPGTMYIGEYTATAVESNAQAFTHFTAGALPSTIAVSLTTLHNNDTVVLFFSGGNPSITGTSPAGFTTEQLDTNISAYWDNTIASVGPATYTVTGVGPSNAGAAILFGVVLNSGVSSFIPQIGAFFCGI
jgi:hypothetical protein